MALSKEETNRYREEFYSSEKTRFAQNIVSQINPLKACLNPSAINASNHVFNHKVDEVKPMTAQGETGRCWLFAALNAMRIPFMKSMELDEMEFSQAHLYFWDKIEKSNYFLTTMAKVFKDEAPDSRLASYLLQEPVKDGGQWDMFCNIIEKYGVMPKEAFPDTYSCKSDRNNEMNKILNFKLREFAQELCEAVSRKESKEDVQKRIKGYMSTVFRIVGICLGVPPETFTWQYYDKSKKAHEIGPISPLEFYTTYVKPHFNVYDKICLVNDDRNPMGKTYTVKHLGNVVDGKETRYYNQNVDVLVELASKSIQAGEPVWFGCDADKFWHDNGFVDLKLYDFNLVFDTQIHLGMKKSDRLTYGGSFMNHAMLLTGVHIEGEKPVKWRIENSWGEEKGAKGYWVMSNEWFKEFVFEVCVDRKFCSNEILDSLASLEPLPPWDPMGALAKSCDCGKKRCE